MSKRLATFAIAALSLAGSSTAALAHAHLKSSTPADKSTVASPQELDLSFSEELNLKFTGLTLTGPDKKPVKTGEATLMDEKSGLMVPVPGKLDVGSYSVDWHALSADGHKTTGSFTFSVKP